ncbi:MAG: DUF2140 family protein [Tumebacillaceae bacterium]
MQNPWRLAFWVLFLGVVAVMITVTSIWMKVTHPRESAPSQTNVYEQGVPIDASVSLAAINQFVDMQLADKQTPVQDAEVLFESEQQRVRINTSLTFFGRVMDMAVWMKPQVLPNGDVQMVAEEAKMGNWPIPLKTLFAVLEGLPWPPWVHVHSEQHTLDFNLSERPTQNGTHYKIKKIDWAKQMIQVQVLLNATPKSLAK